LTNVVLGLRNWAADTMNNVATTPRQNRKCGFSGRITLVTVPVAFLIFVFLGIVVAVARWGVRQTKSLSDIAAACGISNHKIYDHSTTQLMP
jgi:hypothetical protein